MKKEIKEPKLKITEFTAFINPKGGIINKTIKRQETDEEYQDRIKRTRQEEEKTYEKDKLTEKEKAIWRELDALIDSLRGEMVDVSFFPHGAQMQLIRYSKLIAKIT